MSDKPISPLRQRMIDDMTARRFSEATRKDYVRNVRNFTAFLGRSPDTATSDDLRRFQLHMAQQQVSPWSINAAIAALRFFFTVTLERPDLVRPLRMVNEPRKAPVVLSQEEVARLLYFGEGPAGYVIVKTGAKEFDYPKGQENAYTTYDGSAGIPIGGTLWRTLFAWNLGDMNILLSGYLTPESRILLHRNIRDRVRTIAPFLRLDHDPYLVVSGGRLFWFQDAYTVSEWFPYATPEPEAGDINYIRNSVKIVIDAYNGSVAFYVADPADPIVETYRRIFPTLFKPLDAMPPNLRLHIRYPEDLFTIQALQYRAFHMTVPEVFYNREDLWQFPREAAAPDEVEGGAETARMAPYYIMMRLPGEDATEFFLMLPMTPSRRENMIAWLAARCDPPEYGKLIVYEFPKEKLIYGPFQIDALINQNTEISQQISLWNQMGSRVIRGNLLVVPIGNSILYVSPLYLRARSGQLPELKRVIAAYGDRVVMEETLPAALAALFRQTAPVAGPPAIAGPAPMGPAGEQAKQALAAYDGALERLKAGDWAGFGKELDALRPLLEELSRRPAGH